MNNSKTPITGIVETDNRTYAFYLDNYTIREIAAILGCPQGTVSSKFHRTLKKLKEKLS